MMRYSTAVMVKAMKIQEVILRATSKQIHWTEAADIIGISYRTMKRWKFWGVLEDGPAREGLIA